MRSDALSPGTANIAILILFSLIYSLICSTGRIVISATSVPTITGSLSNALTIKNPSGVSQGRSI